MFFSFSRISIFSTIILQVSENTYLAVGVSSKCEKCRFGRGHEEVAVFGI